MSKWLHKLPKKNKAPDKQKQSREQNGIQNLDRYRHFLKVRRILSLILAGCAVIALVVVLATAFFSGKFTEFFYHVKQFSAEDNYPVTIKEQSFTDAAGLNRYLAIMTKNGIVFLDEKGDKAQENVLGYSSPVMRYNKQGVLVYDQGGTQFQYVQPFQLGFSMTTEQKIITGALSENGNCAIATYHDRYAAEVTVYNADGSISYRWYSASDKVMQLAFDPDGRRLYVCCINAEDGFLQTIVYALSAGSDKELYRTALSNSVSPLYLQPMSNGRLAVITTGSIEFLNSSGIASDTSYYYSDLYAACGSERYLAIAQQNVYNNTTNLIVYTPDGEKVASTEITDTPVQLDISGSKVYCLTDNTLIQWDFSDNQKEYIIPEENCSGMVLFKDTVYLYNNNNIDRAVHTAANDTGSEENEQK